MGEEGAAIVQVGEDDGPFDLVIEGTGLTEAILAASASWAGYKVLHTDENDFYGSHWAALSLDQLDTWVKQHETQDDYPYHSAVLTRVPTSTLSQPSPLQSSRAYSIDLSPHLLYCSSDIVSCLANTKISEYLEFKALDSIFLLQNDPSSSSELKLDKVPSSREDIFTSSSLSLSEKRNLMKFITFSQQNLSSTAPESLDDLLKSPEYHLPENLRNAIQYAIALSPTPGIGQKKAFKAIQRHVAGFSVYGPFPLIVPLHGGGGELSQAFCRTAAVNGATYILNRKIRDVRKDEGEYPFDVTFDVEEGEALGRVRCGHLVRAARERSSRDTVEITKRVCIVGGGGNNGVFDELFSSDAQFKDAALVIVPPHALNVEQDVPIQIILHGGGIGECPMGQWIIYSSIRQSGASALDNLVLAEDKLLACLSSADELQIEKILELTYRCVESREYDGLQRDDEGIVHVDDPSESMDFDDAYSKARKIHVELFGEEDDFMEQKDTNNEDEDE